MNDYFAVCAPGIEPATAAELIRLEATDVQPLAGGVAFRGELTILYRACLWLRTASRVLRPLREFAAATAEMLYSQTRRVRWEDYLDPTKTLAVQATLAGAGPKRDAARRGAPRDKGRREAPAPTRPGIHHSMFAALKIKDAIVDRLRREQGARPNVDRENPDVLVHAHFAAGRCTLSLDAVGGSLHERGYRSGDAPAPLKESLAAAIIELSGWDGAAPLVDPLCGSGTLLIEAALRAQRAAPGLGRERFACQRWPDFDAALWRQTVEQARQERRSDVPGVILGSDSDPAAVRTAREQARRAGVEGAIRFETLPLERAAPPGDTPGVLVTNPPYGERLGDAAELTGLYRQLGELIASRFGGWSAWVLAGNLSLARHIDLPARQKIKLYNGPIPCRLLQFTP